MNSTLKFMIETALNARKIILEIYNSSDLDVKIKDDDSPVTKADLLANSYIVESLKKAYPNYGILSEELKDDKERLTKEYVFLVDPIDGTKDFIYHDDEYTVNIALVKGNEVVAGVIDVPSKGETYYASKGNGAYVLKEGVSTLIKVSDKDDDLKQLCSRFHVSEAEISYFKNHLNINKLEKHGSAYKACLIASGKAEIYLKKGKGTKEWDVAPSAIIVKEAGGFFGLPNGEEMLFNRENVYNEEGFLILNKPKEEYFVKD